MPRYSIFHVDDLSLRSSVSGCEHSFSVLPFVVGSRSNIGLLRHHKFPEYSRGSFYLQLLKGIDWLVARRSLDVLSLSLGQKHGVFSEFEPIHIATRHAFEQKAIVVTAAGNRGLR